ncbi:hypothetical protein ELY37_18220 [Vreelandella populi]|uniref:Transposase n=1 Tax=Vreelandella populi TaxID=2498858 RepID=A0A3S0WLT6_9GAMM|nr:hypothetical protein ELY37_18220 [Halomonas populi]
MWRQLRHEGVNVAHSNVEQLMLRLEVRGVVQGQRPFTTFIDPA